MSKKVLIVDDDPGILDAVSMILEDSGYQVSTEVKGEKTYEKVSSFKPNIILLDVLMSGNDGRTICKNLKSGSDTKNIPIILTSAHPDISSYAKEFKADGFIPKPFEIDALLGVIKKQLKRND
jgi:DNA-binding response OmpR family regulator